jgi:hypothetical protein
MKKKGLGMEGKVALTPGNGKSRPAVIPFRD